MTKSELQEIREWVNYLTILIESYDTFDLKLKGEIIRTGTDIAHSVFDLTRRDKRDSILEVFNAHENSFEENTGFTINGDVNFYFGYCKVVGEDVARGTPEKIDKLLKGTFRLVK